MRGCWAAPSLQEVLAALLAVVQLVLRFGGGGVAWFHGVAAGRWVVRFRVIFSSLVFLGFPFQVFLGVMGFGLRPIRCCGLWPDGCSSWVGLLPFKLVLGWRFRQCALDP